MTVYTLHDVPDDVTGIDFSSIVWLYLNENGQTRQHSTSCPVICETFVRAECAVCASGTVPISWDTYFIFQHSLSIKDKHDHLIGSKGAHLEDPPCCPGLCKTLVCTYNLIVAHNFMCTHQCTKKVFTSAISQPLFNTLCMLKQTAEPGILQATNGFSRTPPCKRTANDGAVQGFSVVQSVKD